MAVAVTPLDGEYVAEAGIRHLGSKGQLDLHVGIYILWTYLWDQ